MKCIICGKEAIDEYCESHKEAYRNIYQKFDEWQQAMDISWKEYLKELAENSYTGTWAKEVIEHLQKNKEKKEYG